MITYRGESKVIKELCRVVNSAGASSLEVIDGELYAVYDGGSINLSHLIPDSEKGAPEGVAELDENGLVLASQLPSYVDAVEEHDSLSDFPVPGESGKIYVAIDTSLTYRWAGSSYVEISPSIALGETSSTAYRGDRGAVAYAHVSDTSNPHHVTKAQLGLDRVNNTSDSEKTVDKAVKDGAGNVIASTYETKLDADDKLTSAKSYTDVKTSEAKAYADDKLIESEAYARSLISSYSSESFNVELSIRPSDTVTATVYKDGVDVTDDIRAFIWTLYDGTRPAGEVQTETGRTLRVSDIELGGTSVRCSFTYMVDAYLKSVEDNYLTTPSGAWLVGTI
ncbi:hypothetical protein ACR77V_12265 [Staphylococcus epidermidis]|uniref:hypothetical protein n=1 Tax=Staphylococcus epidermidis TaxID=1282 RepID=UPI003DA54204